MTPIQHPRMRAETVYLRSNLRHLVHAHLNSPVGVRRQQSFESRLGGGGRTYTYADYLRWSGTQLEAGRYGRASVLELKGKTQIAAVPGITIDWDEILVKIS